MVIGFVCIQALLVGFEGVYPLWALSTPDRGGLGWATIDIGQVLREYIPERAGFVTD